MAAYFDSFSDKEFCKLMFVRYIFRHELQKQVIFSSSFKLFLELEPQLRDIIFKFYESKYASCLKLLDEIKDNILLDMYIAPHVNTLYLQIRNRAIIQYFSPYLSADMRRMATAFNRTVAALEDELMQLILDGQIQARIDSHNKVLKIIVLLFTTIQIGIRLNVIHFIADFIRQRCRSA